MKTINHMPATPEIKTCEKHGDYEVKYMETFNGKYWVTDHCMTCISESNAEAKLKEENEKATKAIEHEKKRREMARVNAGISKRNRYKVFEDYKCESKEQTKAKNDCVRYVDSFPCDRSMIMVGGVGTGKTLLASIMLESLVDEYNCEIIKVIEVIRHLKSSWSKSSETTEEKIIDYYINLDLLILDEIGSQFGSDTEKLFIFDIIDGRYQEMKPTILISNLDINGIKEVIGDRCVDRLREGGGSMIAFNWESSRT